MVDCNAIENDSGVWSLKRLVTSYNYMLIGHNGSTIEDEFWPRIDESQLTIGHDSQITTHNDSRWLWTLESI